MKLARVKIENFRHLGTSEQPFELDFTDALGRVREVTLITGPNCSGKTTVLDAISVAVGLVLGWADVRWPIRRRFPGSFIRTGAAEARVSCELRGTEEEVAAIRERLTLAGEAPDREDERMIGFTWTSSKKYQPERRESGSLPEKRVYFHSEDVFPWCVEGVEWLARSAGSDEFLLVQKRYHQLFRPREIIGVAPGEGLIQFSDGVNTYDFWGMGAGEFRVLSLLAFLVMRNIRNSVVLIDDFDLHLQPTRQHHLEHILKTIGEGNQFIITGHSPYLREGMPTGAVVNLEEREYIRRGIR